MQYGAIPGIDKPISRLVQGTGMIGSEELEAGFALLDQAFELGCTAFDTARIYRKGDSERVLGRWIRERGLREQAVVISKGVGLGPGDSLRVTPQNVTSDLYDSLECLRTEYIDLYLLHRDDPSVPVGPLVEVLNEHLRAGRIRAIGGSNWSHDRIQAANAYAAERRLAPFVASSPQFSLAEQLTPPWVANLTISGSQGADARRWYESQNLPVFAWSSLAGGFFSGRFRRDNLESFSDQADVRCIGSYASEANFQRLDRAKELAGRKSATVPQIALAYVLRQPLNIFAVTGCATTAECADNAGAVEIELSAEELAWLEGG
jgi:aryl-alcohol dehydrogenase-like predicted oxidoreductase